MKGKLMLISLVILAIFTSSGIAQNGFEGAHDYQGEQEDTENGTFSGSIQDGTVNLQTQTVRRIREYTIAYADFGGTESKDFTPYNLTDDIDTDSSKTSIHLSVSCGLRPPSGSTAQCTSDISINGNSLHDISNCERDPEAAASLSSSLEIRNGYGYTEVMCMLDEYHSGVHDIVVSGTCTFCDNSRRNLIIKQTEVYNETILTPTGTITGNVTGTYSGTSTGSHNGSIEQITADATVDNITFTNVTAENILGTLAFADTDFWLPLLLWLILILLAEWKRDGWYFFIAALMGIYITIAIPTFAPAFFRTFTIIITLYLAVRSYLIYREVKAVPE